MDIQKMLRKRKYTGREAGQVLLYSLAYDIESLGQEYDPPVTQEDINRIQSHIVTTSEQMEYNRYVALYRSFSDLYNTAVLMTKQFYAGYYKLLLHLREALLSSFALDIRMEGKVYTLAVLRAEERVREQLKNARHSDVYFSMRRLAALNILFVYMAQQLEVPGLAALQTDMQPFRQALRELNHQRDLLIARVGESIDDIFPEFGVEDVALSENILERARDFSLFDLPAMNIIAELET